MDLSEYPPERTSGPSGASEQTPRPNTITADFWVSIFGHRQLFETIGKGLTRGDIRLAFAQLRALRAKWLEKKVLTDKADFDAMLAKFDAHTINFLEINAQRDAEELFERIDRHLIRYSMYSPDHSLSLPLLTYAGQAYQDDRAAALAPRASRHYLDTVMRYHILKPEKGLKGPNGQAQNFFGEVGEPSDPGFISICEFEQSFFSYLVVKWLMRFYYIIRHSLQTFQHNVLGKSIPDTAEDEGIGQQTHDVLVSGLESSLSCAYMAGSIALSVNLSSQTNRLISMSIMSLVFPFTVIFLSSKGVNIFVLCAAYVTYSPYIAVTNGTNRFWAVTVTLIPRGSLAD